MTDVPAPIFPKGRRGGCTQSRQNVACPSEVNMLARCDALLAQGLGQHFSHAKGGIIPFSIPQISG